MKKTQSIRVSCHDSSGSIDFSDLFLSSSMDWTVKLWSARWSTHTLISTQFPNSNTYIGIIVGLDNDVMDDQGEERIVLL